MNEIEWTGNLDDDCSAKFFGLHLRAESMGDGLWWIMVYDGQGEPLIDQMEDICASPMEPFMARHYCEVIALSYLKGKGLQ